MNKLIYNDYEIEYVLSGFTDDESWCEINYCVYEKYLDELRNESKNEIFHLGINYNGCSHLDLDNIDEHLHLCASKGYEEFFNLLKFLYEQAFILMNREFEYNIEDISFSF